MSTKHLEALLQTRCSNGTKSNADVQVLFVLHRHDRFICNTLTGVDLVSLAGVFNSVLRESDVSTKINDKFN